MVIEVDKFDTILDAKFGDNPFISRLQWYTYVLFLAGFSVNFEYVFRHVSGYPTNIWDGEQSFVTRIKN